MKSKKLKSISYKLVVAFFIVILTVILLIWIMQAIMLKSTYNWFREKQVESSVNIIEKDLEDNILEINIDELSINRDFIVYILDSSKDIMYSSIEYSNSLPKGLEKEILKIIQNIDNEKINETVNLTKNKIDYNIYGKPCNNNYILIISKLAPVEATVEIIKIQLIVISIISIIISICIAIIIAKKIAKPIEETSKNARKLSNNNFDVEFNHYEYIEIKELSDTLNKASKDLKEKDRIKKEIIANVSHDLKTPLSIIKGYCEMLQDITGDNKEKRIEQLDKIKKETDKLTFMINDMLDLSKLDNKNSQLKLENFSISKLVKEVLGRLDKLIEEANIKVEYRLKDDVIIKADKSKMGQALYNLIINAINFVGKDKMIIIDQIMDNDIVRIEIKDNGIGIDEKDIPFIFERYYKTNNKYAVNGFSTGLGLAIVKAIFEQHKFKYGVMSKKGKGTSFWFEFKEQN